MTDDTPQSEQSDPWGPAFVRVTSVRRGLFVEFDFGIGAPDDRDLCVEMVMPFEAFVDFCKEHRALMLPGAEEAALAYLELSQRRTRTPPSTTATPTSQPTTRESGAPRR